MKWILQNTQHLTHHWLLANDVIKADLSYNREIHSVRLNCTEKRLYFLKPIKGLKTSGFFITNEYNFKEAECKLNKDHFSGSLALDNTMLRFEVNEDDKLILFSPQKRLVSYNSIDDLRNLEAGEFSALIFACGYISLRHHTRARPVY